MYLLLLFCLILSLRERLTGLASIICVLGGVVVCDEVCDMLDNVFVVFFLSIKSCYEAVCLRCTRGRYNYTVY